MLNYMQGIMLTVLEMAGSLVAVLAKILLFITVLAIKKKIDYYVWKCRKPKTGKRILSYSVRLGRHEYSSILFDEQHI